MDVNVDAEGLQPAASGGLVDIHTHAIAPSLPDLETLFPWGHWPSVQMHTSTTAQIQVGGRPYREIDDRCWSAERRIADMDADGVAVQLVSPTPITFCHDAPVQGAIALAQAQNDFLADLTGRFPDRLAALGAVPMQDPRAAVAEMERAMSQLGFRGVEIGTRVGDRELSHPDFDEFFSAAAELDAFVLIHPADNMLDARLTSLVMSFGVGMPSETGMAAAELLSSGAFERRPAVHLCLAHGGGTLPWLLPRLDRGAMLKDPTLPAERLPSALARRLCSDSLTYDAESLALAVHRFTADHVLFGSDYPFPAKETPAGAVLAGPTERLDTDMCAAIGWRNAYALTGHRFAADGLGQPR
ncbi:amidohydrolase [Mycobacterium sp. CBMA271]|uniref:amidohydrolase family protein n=1 Tax=unclassified Mycobacteroides TaxID=2618759 RepID=UPI0012DE7578|nr:MULTISPECIES: amidohydrolase family protein [unclassified Mycobacteroides]MUM18864.1 aminocarboxymuconate-semialdehyde decarboxylase [Mycobacteroides sp. CBMA 326]MUM23196.1 amidohydrolase [Mycobacteroides sp. CBMA 271]